MPTEAEGFVASPAYKQVVNDVVKKARIVVDPTVYDVLIADAARKAGLAGVTVEELATLLQKERDTLVAFAVAKIRKFDAAPSEQEYPSGEPPDDEEDESAEDQGYSYDFLLLYLIEFSLLRQKSAALDAYLKAARIPGAKKYAQELRALYDRL